MEPKKVKLQWSEINHYEADIEVPYEEWKDFEDEYSAFDWYYFKETPSRPPKIISGEFEPDSIVVKVEE